MTTFEEWTKAVSDFPDSLLSQMYADWKAEREKLIKVLEEAKRASDNINELCGYEDVLPQWAEAADKALTDISLVVGAVLTEVKNEKTAS